MANVIIQLRDHALTARNARAQAALSDHRELQRPGVCPGEPILPIHPDPRLAAESSRLESKGG